MLVLRSSQISALESAMGRRFERRMRRYLSRHFPSGCRALGEARVAALVRSGIGHARRWGFVQERDISRYLVLMLVLSPRFDRSEAHPWAAEILADPCFVSPHERMDVLYAAADRHLMREHASGRGAPPQAG